MDLHHAEPVQEEFKMDYSEWSYINIIPAILFFGFIAGIITIFV